MNIKHVERLEELEARTDINEAMRIAALMIEHDGALTHGTEFGSLDEYTVERHEDWSFHYINTGDTYSETIVRDRDGTYSIGCWGDALEELEAAYAESSGKRKCGYDGEWTHNARHIAHCEGEDVNTPDNLITKRFIIEEHEGHGALGARPVNMPHADPLSGMASAHDMLEHFEDDDGGIECEFMSLGAAYFLRGETGWFGTRGIVNTEPEENIAADFPALFSHYVHEGFTLHAPVDLIKHIKNTDPDVWDDDFCSVHEAVNIIVRKALELIHDEWLDDSMPAGECDVNDDYTNKYREWTVRRDRIIGHMMNGYARAKARYANVDAYTLAHEGFTNIETAVDAMIEEGNEGLEFDVTLNTDTMDVTVHERWE